MAVLKSAVMGPGGVDRINLIDGMLHPKDDVPDSEFRQQLERFRERQRQMDRVERGLAVGPHIHDPGEDVSGA